MSKSMSLLLALGVGLLGGGEAFAETVEVAAVPEAAILPLETIATAASASGYSLDVSTDDSQDVASDNGGMEVAFTPYLWMAGINGQVGIPRNEDEVDVDRSFGDILGDLKFAFMGTLDVNYRRFIVHADTIYLNLGADVERVDSLIFKEGEFDAKLLIATGALGYRVVDKGPLHLDLYAGARLVSLDVDLALEGPLQTRTANVSPSNVSPLVGARARIPFNDRWSLGLQGNIGFDSDVKWEVAGTVHYRLDDHWQMGVGYRHLQLHHDKPESEIDFAFSGPLLAFTYFF